jgi:hypothetical protein
MHGQTIQTYNNIGQIKEPDGIDFVVDNKSLTDIERKQISEIIVQYKATGRKTSMPITTRDKTRGRKKHERTT